MGGSSRIKGTVDYPFFKVGKNVRHEFWSPFGHLQISNLMPEDFNEKTLLWLSWSDGGTGFSAVKKPELIVQGKITLSFVYAVMAFVAMFGQHGTDLVFEKFHLRRVVR